MGHNILQLNNWKPYYENFVNGNFPHPSKDPETYNIPENFFRVIAYAIKGLEDEDLEGLEKLLLGAGWDRLEEQTPLGKDVDMQVISTAHSEVSHKTALDLLKEARLDYQNINNVKWLTGHSGTMLGEKGKEDIKKSKYKGQIVICSDLPRAIHCALLKYAPETKEKLDKFAKDVLAQIINNKGIIEKETHDELVELALEHNIIPIPLVRAAFYGHMELLPGESIDFDVDRIFESGLAKMLGYSKEDVTQIGKYLKHRSDAAYHAEDENGFPVSEDRLMFYIRVKPLLDLFLPNGKFYDRVKGRTIDIVGHSGLTDIIVAYYRHFRNIKEIAVTREPKELTRGKEYLIKLKSTKNNFIYLNDPKLLEPIKEGTEKEVKRLRGLSVDTLIKEKEKGIVETPLLGFRKKNEREYEPYSEKLEDALKSDDVLKSNDPIIIFGHGGQGKTILATEIARKFLKGEFSEYYKNYVPIILNCGDNINPYANRNMVSSRDPQIKSIVMEPVSSQGLHGVLLEEYKFVFIIDDYQKLNQDYTNAMEDTVHKLRKEGNLVLLLSRMERTDIHPPHNPGYKTIQIDTEAIAQENDNFIEGRIDTQHIERFKEYLEQYDSSVTGNYLTKLFLTMIFPIGNGENRGILEYITDDSIKKAIEEGRPLKTTQLYEAQTDYITGCDIHRKDDGLSFDAVREEIVRWKNYLAEKAFNDVFGKDVDNEL